MKTQGDLRNHENKRELVKIFIELESKMDCREISKLWDHLKRFPFYEDLKELNDKFLPELAKL